MAVQGRCYTLGIELALASQVVVAAADTVFAQLEVARGLKSLGPVTWVTREIGDQSAAIEALPENFRLAVLLADVEGFAYKEIAEILDIPIGTVMSRLHRGRKALQKELYEYASQRGLTARPQGPDGAGATEPVDDRQPARTGPTANDV